MFCSYISLHFNQILSSLMLLGPIPLPIAPSPPLLMYMQILGQEVKRKVFFFPIQNSPCASHFIAFVCVFTVHVILRAWNACLRKKPMTASK